MPNHIHNKIEFFGKETDVKAITDFIKDAEGNFDFNKIIPMPEELNIDIHSGIETLVKENLQLPLHDNWMIAGLEYSNRKTAAEKGFQNFSEEDKKLYHKAVENQKKYGFIYWYDWRNVNWGTKWGAYSQSLNRNTYNTFYYQTAWNQASKVIKALADKFPSVHIKHSYACEYGNSQAGIDEYNNGWHKHTDLSKNNDDKRMFLELTGRTPADYDWDENFNNIDEY